MSCQEYYLETLAEERQCLAREVSLRDPLQRGGEDGLPYGTIQWDCLPRSAESSASVGRTGAHSPRSSIKRTNLQTGQMTRECSMSSSIKILWDVDRW